MTPLTRRLAWLVFALAALASGSRPQAIAEPLGFGYPAAGEAWYFIEARMGSAPPAKEGAWSVVRVEVNGARARDFRLLRDGHALPAAEVKGLSPVDLQIRWSWTGKQAYEIRVELQNTKSG
ncbi:MAG: hypothetical protein FJY80_01150, partial [Candidatus Aminicenantes bacterium]|nr:hypothetical protein [Candidatus Aminicenantes bacterium]